MFIQATQPTIMICRIFAYIKILILKGEVQVPPMHGWIEIDMGPGICHVANINVAADVGTTYFRQNVRDSNCWSFVLAYKQLQIIVAWLKFCNCIADSEILNSLFVTN